MFAGKILSGGWQKKENSNPVPVKLVAKEEQSLPFSMIMTEAHIKLHDTLTQSPTATYVAASVWPTGSDNTAQFIKTVVKEDFGIKDKAVNIWETLASGQNSFLNEYLEDNKDLPDSLFTEFPYSYSFYEDHKLLIAFQSPKLLTLASHVYSYTGGAHGNYGTAFTTIDLVLRRRIKLSDVLSPAGINKLRLELEAEFRRQSGLKGTDPLTEAGLFENRIEPNENFLFNPNGHRD
jgi:hypothetical protein